MTYFTYIIVFIVIIIVFVVLYKIFRFVVGLLLIGLFLIIAYFTNPTEQQHREAVLIKAKKTGSFKPKKIRRENYYIFSLTAVDQAEDHKIIGAGAFTQVFIFSKP